MKPSAMNRRWPAVVLICLVFLPQGLARGEAPAVESARVFVLPPDAGVVDVTKPPYNAVPDDQGDDTAAIQAALNDHANQNQIIYLPDGVYHVSDTLTWPKGSHGGAEYKRTILQGQSRDGTILQLQDKCPAFGDPAKGKAMLWTGKKPAQRFRNGVWNLTLDTGKGNPGAIGAQYIANNQGSMRHVLIRSGSPDGAGVIGLDLGFSDEQGPCLIKDVTVRGFDVGVSLRAIVDSVTIEDITLQGQRVVGLSNGGQCVSIRKLKSENKVPAIEQTNINSLIVLLDSDLQSPNGNPGPAILNRQGAMLVRDTTITGYGVGVVNEAKEGTKHNAEAGKIGLYVSHQALMVAGKVAQGQGKTLRLPIKETPALPQPALEFWAGPQQFGGSPDDDADDTAAVQQAIDSGAKVIYFPHPTAGKPGWKIDGVVEVRGNVQRLTALEGRLAGGGTIRVVNGQPDTVCIDRLDLIYQRLNIENASDRTLVLSGISRGKGDVTVTGKGDLFLEDIVGGEWRFNGINVWARQFNAENEGVKVLNAGGKFWCLGIKTEKAGTICQTTDGGQTEILGGFIYAQGKPKTTPMFIVEGVASAMTASVGETTWNERNFKTILSVQRSGQTADLEYSKDIYWRNNKAAMLPLLMALPE